MPSTSKLILESLHIQNLATFQNEKICFSEGLNTIVGETGSGKSLILDALQMILGARADRKLVRKEAEFASIEATFVCHDEVVKDDLDQKGYPVSDEQIVIKRILYPNGRSKSFLNFSQCPLTVLADFSRSYIDLVGQFENQKLLSQEYQIYLLDSYAGQVHMRSEYLQEFVAWKESVRKLEELLLTQKEKEQRQDYLQFQITEIEKLEISTEEEQNLVRKKESLLEGKKQIESLQKINYLLSEKESGDILSMIRQCVAESSGGELDQVQAEQLGDAVNILEEIAFSVSKKIDAIDQGQEELEEVMNRLDDYQKIKRKYNSDLDEILNEYSLMKKEADELKGIDEKVKQQSIVCQELRDRLVKVANILHENRQIAAKKLSVDLTSAIQELRMQGAQIRIELNRKENLNQDGVSEILFLAQTNIGEGFHCLEDIASGGELSRILLGLRNIVSSRDSISIFLFDEIDTGIGGETAICVGQALQNVSKDSQVLAITHLAQIAKFSERVIFVEKGAIDDGDEKRTISSVEEFGTESLDSILKKMVPL